MTHRDEALRLLDLFEHLKSRIHDGGITSYFDPKVYAEETGLSRAKVMTYFKILKSLEWIYVTDRFHGGYLIDMDSIIPGVLS